MADKYKAIAVKLELALKKMRSEGMSRLPSEQSLCGEYSCSRQTIRAALDVLCQKGLIVKKRGAGSYLAGNNISNKTVFFITEDCDRYQSPILISGVKDQLLSSRYELKTFSTEGSISKEAQILKKAIEDRPAALIIEPSKDLIPDPNLYTVDKIKKLGIPVIYCNSSLGDIHVVTDNTEGSRALTGHLLENGRKKIACILRMDESSGRDRYQGYLNALLDFGTDFDESACLLITGKEEQDILSGLSESFSRFIDNRLFLCDAVICQNAMIAHQLKTLLRKRGVSVPKDLLVACFDSSHYSSNKDVLSAGYDNEVFSKALAKTAIALAEGRDAKSITVPVKIHRYNYSRAYA